MRAGKKPSKGGNAMQQQMAQMQVMQQKMAEAQDEIDKMEASATSGGGAITVTVSGARQLTKVEIKPEAFDPDDIEMLEDLVITATNEALRQMEEVSSQEMNKLTGGLGIPGL